MILVVGGLNGFIGSNTTEALVDQGQDCVVTRHENSEVPGFLKKHIDHRHAFVEPADSTSIADLRRIGEKHKIDGIVNVAGGFASGEGPLRGLRGYFDMLNATFQVAQEWKVKRVTFSSTGGMYLGLQGTANEDAPISLPSMFPILAYQKIVEVAADQFAKKTGINTICVRLMGMFGPFDGGQLGLAPRLVHAAVSGKPPNLKDVFFALHQGHGPRHCTAPDRRETPVRSLQHSLREVHFEYRTGGSGQESGPELQSRPSPRTLPIPTATYRGDQTVRGGHWILTQVRHSVGHSTLCRLA